MRNIYVIGTTHGYTDKLELEDLLKEINPEQVLVELLEEEYNRDNKEDSIRDEMYVARDWARKNNSKIDFFDVNILELRDGMTGKEKDFVDFSELYFEAMKKFTWKELNKKSVWTEGKLYEMESMFNDKYLDKDKLDKREKIMLENIQQKMISSGTLVILTGCGHLDFFQTRLPEANFPLR